MKYSKNFIALLTLMAFVNLSNVAKAQAVPIDGEATFVFSILTGVAKHGVLVQRKKPIQVCDNGDCYSNISDLRVSYLLLDGGPSTDVSPRYSLYLTTYNSVDEFASAYSIHLIENVDELYDVERVKAGIYKFEYKQLAELLNFETSSRLNCPYYDVTAVIDARDLTAKVRQAKKLKFLQDIQYYDPIYLSVSDAKCSKN